MKEGMPSAIYLKDYTPPEYLIDTIDLHFSLEETATVVRTTQSFHRNPAHKLTSTELVLNGAELKLLSVSLDQRELNSDAYSVSGESLIIHNVPEKFLLEITTEIHPETNTALEGLYKSNGMYCT